jgi:hypothetical protein
MTPAVVKVGQVKGITSIGGSSSDIDISNMDSVVKEFAKGLKDGGSPSFDIVFNPNAASHILLHTLSELGTGATKSFYFGWSDGTSLPHIDSNGALTAPTTRSGISFDGYVKQFQLDASTDSVLMGKVQLKATGSDTITVKA